MRSCYLASAPSPADCGSKGSHVKRQHASRIIMYYLEACCCLLYCRNGTTSMKRSKSMFINSPSSRHSGQKLLCTGALAARHSFCRESGVARVRTAGGGGTGGAQVGQQRGTAAFLVHNRCDCPVVRFAWSAQGMKSKQSGPEPCTVPQGRHAAAPLSGPPRGWCHPSAAGPTVHPITRAMVRAICSK